MNERWFWSPLLLLSALGAGLIAMVLPGTVLCLIVVIWFLLVCPGMMVVRYMNLQESVTEWTIAIALSMAIDGIVAAVALYAGFWSPRAILGSLIVICITGVLMRFILSERGLTDQLYARRRGVLVFLLLILVAFSAGILIWSYNVYSHAAGANSTVQRAESQVANPTSVHSLNLTAKPIDLVDVVIVMDNVDKIATYDPQSKRYKAAQLFVNMTSIGDEVGIVRITSTDEPIPVLPLQALQTYKGQEHVKNLLTEKSFGPVDTNPVAYFTPALEMAGNMLMSGPTNHRKAILIFTDALAFSGDQNACNSSPDSYHNWFCEIQSLKQQGIVVSLVGFTTTENKAMLQPVQQFFTTQEGFALPVVDTDNLSAQLSRAYRDVLNQA